MLKKGRGICVLIVLLLLCSQALATEATPEPWQVYQTLESSSGQVEVLLDCSRYKDVHMCVINVDDGSFLPELAKGTTLFWDGNEQIAVITWDTYLRTLTFSYRPSSKKQYGTSVVGELLFSYFNSDGERIIQDRVNVVLTDAGLRLSVKSVEETPQPTFGWLAN